VTQIENTINLLSRSLETLKMTLADFSDADMLVRPCPGANHAAWQLGHLTNAETGMVNAVQPGALPAAPAGFVEKFKKETASVADPKFFPGKAELVDAFSKARAATIAWAQSLSQADLDRPAPEKFLRFAPTVGLMLLMMPSHVMMHTGQFQVIRRKLGKPTLF